MTQDEARRIHDRIDALSERLGGYHGDVKAIFAACEPCKRQVDRLTATVYGGNGEGEGLTSKVSRNSWLANGIAALVGGSVVAIVSILFR